MWGDVGRYRGRLREAEHACHGWWYACHGWWCHVEVPCGAMWRCHVEVPCGGAMWWCHVVVPCGGGQGRHRVGGWGWGNGEAGASAVRCAAARCAAARRGARAAWRGQRRARTTGRLYLPYISPTSPLHLPYISPTSPAPQAALTSWLGRPSRHVRICCRCLRAVVAAPAGSTYGVRGRRPANSEPPFSTWRRRRRWRRWWWWWCLWSWWWRWRWRWWWWWWWWWWCFCCCLCWHRRGARRADSAARPVRLRCARCYRASPPRPAPRLASHLGGAALPR